MTSDDLTAIRAIVGEAVGELVRESTRRKRAGLLTLEEAGAILDVTAETVRHWIWEGRLKGYKPGRTVYVKESEILALVEKNELTAKRVARRTARAKGVT